MSDIVRIEDWKVGNTLEKDYQKFLTYVNKYNGIPTNTAELAKCFHHTLRYLEGTVNCFEALSLIFGESRDMLEMKEHVVQWIDSISNDLKKY